MAIEASKTSPYCSTFTIQPLEEWLKVLQPPKIGHHLETMYLNTRAYDVHFIFESQKTITISVVLNIPSFLRDY